MACNRTSVLLILMLFLAASPVVRAQCVATQSATLTASDSAQFDVFGSTVAIDGSVALVGAYHDDDAGNASGSAYIYRFDGSGWVQEQKLVASDAAQNDNFGYAVAVSGDVALVGAPLDDDGGSLSGSAYVFRFNGSSWVEEQKLVASDAAADDHFGLDVSLSGDVAVVGAYLDDDAGDDSGAAYVYRFDGAGWMQEQKLVAADAQAFDYFGFSVAVDDDAIAVGVRWDDYAAPYAGSTCVFRWNGASWLEEQRLLAEDGAYGDEFGYSVAIHDDTVVVGAYRDQTGPGRSGSAYVFRFDGTAWAEDDKLVASDIEEADEFGFSVGVHGDVAVVGAHFDDEGGWDAGSAYIYRRSGNAWVEQHKLVARFPAARSYFGHSVAMTQETALVGAQLADEAATDGGAAFVYNVGGGSVCRAGTVDLGIGSTTADVLFVQGDTGGCVERAVTVPISSPIEVTMQAPPSGPLPAPFALYAWIGEPDASTASPQPLQLGTMCFPTFLSVGIPKPDKVWNNAGHEPLLGAPDFASTPAPSTVISASNGWPQPITVTLQGFIADNGSAAERPGSITNAVVLKVR